MLLGEPTPVVSWFINGKRLEETQNIKVSLLDQRIVAGLGNIYVCEALYRARISPLVAAGSVSKARLERLAAEGLGKQPPVAYRALEFLVENGLAHRIQRLNAFTACQSAHADGQAPAFLICRECQTVDELDAAALRADLSATAGQAGFTVERATIEALGLCAACAGRA